VDVTATSGQSKLGHFVVQHRYRVDPLNRDRLFELLGAIREHALDLGVASWELWLDADDTWQVAETIGYDSWGHYQRLSQKPVPADMADIYRRLAVLTEGGDNGVQTVQWTPQSWPHRS
jgi:hypothetical protein